jgi:phospholipid/cholesterol/gamma-HCH transport system ATP-binding protein|tara:strand:+ start:1801 stop:2556 length:756 start_codon:yes stop_codon:yes gene_type:complete
MKSIIEILNLSKNFDNKNILKKINLKITKGESLVIIGKSGSGKSLLMKCVLGILKPSQGEILIKNKNFFSVKRDEQDLILKSIGVTFQGNALFDSMRIWENISFKLSQNNFFKFSQLKEKVEFSLNQVGLSNSIMYQFPSQLSGGMQKRVAIARAIIDEPEILFFDEPTSGLDPVTGNKINSLIIDNVKRLGSTSITITHDLSSLNKIANKVAMINEGKIIWYGEKQDLKKSKNKTLNEFINIDSDVRIKT